MSLEALVKMKTEAKKEAYHSIFLKNIVMVVEVIIPIRLYLLKRL